jgi:hypothetical protein
MRLTVRKDIGALRTEGVARVNALAGQVRARFVTVIPAQEMIYLEKAAEARRYLDHYPTPEDAPEALDTSPVTGFPFIVAEIGITAPSAYAVAKIYAEGAALFRQVGSAIETIRLGAVAAIEAAGAPAEIDAAHAAAASALALIPLV